MKNRSTITIFLYLACFLGGPASEAEPPVGETKFLHPDDLFRLEGIGRVAFSPDGQWLAYELHRPASAGPTQRLAYIYPQTRSDIWLAHVHEGKPKNLTTGEPDGAGFWNPVWSPDSTRLALLRVKDGKVRLFVYEIGTKKLRQLSDIGVKEDLFGEPFLFWLSADRLVCNAWPDGQELGLVGQDTRFGENVARRWAQAWDGSCVSSLVSDSGQPTKIAAHPVHQGRLALIDAPTAAVQLLAEGEFRRPSLSPDRRRLACYKRSSELPGPRPETRITDRACAELLARGSRLHWIDLGRRPWTLHATTLAEPFDESILSPGDYRLPSWSPDGEELVLRAPVGKEHAFQRLHLGTGKLQTVRPNDLEVIDCSWGNGRQLLVYARPKSSEADAKPRADWWLAKDDAAWINLTQKMAAVPRRWLVREGETVIGLAEGKLWRVSLGSAEARDLTKEQGIQVPSALQVARGGDKPFPWTLAVPGQGQADPIVLLSPATQRPGLAARELKKPTAQAKLRGLDPRGQVGVFSAYNRRGAFLWLSFAATRDRPASVVELFAGNRWLSSIQRGELKPITYTIPGHGEQKGWVLFPPNAKPGVALPLVVEVYGGASYGAKEPDHAQVESAYLYNHQLLAAHGYAVLLPSMPRTDEPCQNFARQVLPAVDRVVALGWADPKRVAVMGFSYGGYTTLCLVGQTDRFRAAVALGTAFSSLAATYGGAIPASRYGDVGHPNLVRLGMFYYFESGQGAMGCSPLEDAEKYRRNSPNTYLKKVRTPVLLIHGDGDPWSAQASEQFYAGLYRQGKRARLVRYFGEGHAIEGRANFNDVWKQIFRWLDEFLIDQRN